MHFVNHDKDLKFRNIPKMEMYRSLDYSGIHLNVKGQGVVAYNITKSINKVYAKTKSTEWKVA